MSKTNISSAEAQAQRLKMKTQNQQLQNCAMAGVGLSQWEAQVLVNVVDDVYFKDTELKTIVRHGQVKYSCIQKTEPAGKNLDKCQMVTVTLTLFDKEDRHELPGNEKQASIDLRRRRMLRVADEAREQEGLLSQEDFAELLMCDVRTIRRDIADLKDSGIVVPTRGTVKDIGPGVTHKALAVRLWLEGKEPTEVAQQIHHSLKATENYLEKFKRVSYLIGKGFTEFEMALTIGISVTAVRTFTELHNEFKNKALFKMRMEEIAIVGKQFQLAEGEKKSLPSSKKSRIGK